MACAIRVGIASGDTRSPELCKFGYRVVALWNGLPHDTAVATEKSALGRWRCNSIGPILNASVDRRSETAPNRHPASTHVRLVSQVGAPGDASEDLTAAA